MRFAKGIKGDELHGVDSTEVNDALALCVWVVPAALGIPVAQLIVRKLKPPAKESEKYQAREWGRREERDVRGFLGLNFRRVRSVNTVRR